MSSNCCIKPFINKGKLSYFLRIYTSNRFIDCLVGFVCTAILQSVGAANMTILNFICKSILDTPIVMTLIKC